MNVNFSNTRQYADQVQSIPFWGITQGSADLLIKRDRAQLLRSYYGDPDGSYTQSIGLIDNALHTGDTSFSGNIHPNAQWAAKAIKTAARKNRFIGFSPSVNGIGGSAGNPFGPLGTGFIYSKIDKALPGDNSDLSNKIKSMTPYVDGNPALWWNTAKENFKVYFRSVVDLIINKWPQQGHHILYEWLKDSSVRSQSVPAQSKAINHGAAMTVISRESMIPRDTLKEYTENGIMRCNVESGNDPFTSSQSIELLAGKDSNGLQGFNPDKALKIIFAIKSALEVARQLINEFSLDNEVRGYATPDLQPSSDDFNQNNSNANSGFSANSSILVGGLVLLGAGAYFFNK